MAWRAWRVVEEGAGLRLRSAVFDETWAPGRPLAAACPRGHAVPEPACACGVYAVRDAREAVRYLVGRDDPGIVHRVIGQAELWGVTVEGERGWRAQFAVPARVLVPARRTNGEPVDAPAIGRTLGLAYAIAAEVIAASEPAALAARFS